MMNKYLVCSLVISYFLKRYLAVFTGVVLLTGMLFTQKAFCFPKQSDLTIPLSVQASSSFQALTPYGFLTIPAILIDTSVQYSTLIDSSIMISTKVSASFKSPVLHRYASVSQIASGTWARVGVKTKGIYRLTYEDLSGMGLPVQGVPSANLRVHGYGGMVPEIAGAALYDDLPENAIMVVDGGDGIFNPGDYLLFYSTGPDTWKYNPAFNTFEYQPDFYSDYSYYFITAGDHPGLRISEKQQPANASRQIYYYNHYDTYHPELYNLIKSGRSWYGDLFDIISEREYSFDAFVTEPGSEISTRFSAVARSIYGSNFTLTMAGNTFILPVAAVSTDFNTNYAHIATNRFNVIAPEHFQSLTVRYNKASGVDMGWLNFIEINAKAKLTYSGEPLSFRITDLTEPVEYIIEGAGTQQLLWDVTNPLNPAYIKGNEQSGTLHFKAAADTMHEYILAGNYLRPDPVGLVANQNLHGLSTPTMVIIAPPEFTAQAVRLATFHSSFDGLNVTVLQPQAVYNEFSSGAPDISAIRNFMKMLWHKAEPLNLPRYVLLFGDASYDYKHRVDHNTNIIPTYETPESLNPVYSYATDDFFVSIDDGEGGNSSDMVDIGIGRLPVVTVEEAEQAVDKIIHYAIDAQQVHGDWRNVIAFVADDNNGNVHMDQADQIATMIDTTYSNYNVDKIFLDAYPQISTPGGQRSPEANAAINQRVGKGALIVNYTGHGGETGWTEEEILSVPDINSWTNYNRLPVFMTATCEFSRYDDPTRVSAGEYVFLNPKGGGIALFSTSRPTYGTPNFLLAGNFYNIALVPQNGTMPRLGDIIRLAKNQSAPDDNNKKFVLLGNPAMTMAYPALCVVTDSINRKPVSDSPDTLRALQMVVISGVITDRDNLPVPNFNGTLFATVYDKETTFSTLGSDGNTPMTFNLRNNIIYKGRVEVVNGKFRFSFIVPLDIAYNFGYGKISYYATDGVTDASGNYQELVVGGISDETIADHEGPEVALYMNDLNFKPGDFTDENPVLLAYVTDSSGINTLGNSIGHDIMAILDDDTQHPYILNEYYRADLNTFKSGTVTFPMTKLPTGMHTLRFKIWDVNNNSSEAVTRFAVVPDQQLILSEIEAWPNPMTYQVDIAINHNQAGKELDAELSVFNLAGVRVAVLNKRVLAEGYRTTMFRWDGMTSGGALLPSGFYIGNLRIVTPEGLSAQKPVKIIISR
ncbi:MAG: type IX secretion system sortase PorU [Lentimicrobiaceae bacterium]